MPLLAHSKKGQIKEQLYLDHVRAVKRYARDYSSEVAQYWSGNGIEFQRIVELAGCWHDLGKLDEENQKILASVSRDKLRPAHEYAGVKYLREREQGEAATLIYSHHRGLPEFARDMYQQPPFEQCSDEYAVKRAERFLAEYVRKHQSLFPGGIEPALAQKNWLLRARRWSGLTWRFALSCLVDADHSDTARNYNNEVDVMPLRPKWEERRQALETYIKKLQEQSRGAPARNQLRQRVYEQCRDLPTNGHLYACESGVGTGKTTAVMAHLLKVAHQRNLRHIFVVLPYTNIINQSVNTYRKALVLNGENADRVVAAHHHQVDFECSELRQLATLWDCPITVTTAVQFFETLAASKTGKLRKLHELAGSAVFIDESHAALPAWLWPQTWLWIKELAQDWGCHFVFASGSLVKFWEQEDFVRPPVALPDLLTSEMRAELNTVEQSRINYIRVPNRLSIPELCDFTVGQQGPRLVIVNTVRSAAEIAKYMATKHDVMHLSTALAPLDREQIISRIKERLEDRNDTDWTLVATSCVEAGVDLNFCSAFRETASVSSMIQIGGRVNRHGEGREGESSVWVFSLDDVRATQNPAMKIPARVLERFFERGDVGQSSASDLCTTALHAELNETPIDLRKIEESEKKKNYPEVSQLYKVIEDESVTVLVEPTLSRFETGESLRSADIVRGSVRIRKNAAKKLSLRALYGSEELYAWTLAYDPAFLGYMDGVLNADAAFAGEFLNA